MGSCGGDLEDKLLSWIIEYDVLFVGLFKSMSFSPDDVDSNASAIIDRDIKNVFDSLTNEFFNHEFFFHLASRGLAVSSSSTSSPLLKNKEEEGVNIIDNSGSKMELRSNINTITARMA